MNADPLHRVASLTKIQSVDYILSLVRQGRPDCRMVFTMNLDHFRLLDGHTGLQAAYEQASLVTADGWPVRWLSGAPERVTGSDLVPALFQAQDPRRKLRVFFLGGEPGVAHRAAVRSIDEYGIDAVGHDCPPFGFEDDPRECRRIVRKINETRPDVLLVGLGAPKQEMWTAAHRDLLEVPVAMCVGATLDFLAGTKTRAPAVVRWARMEWFWRMMLEPRRLAGRYAADAMFLPRIVWQAGMRRAGRFWRGLCDVGVGGPWGWWRE